MPLGTPAFVDNKRRQKVEEVQSPVDTLVTPPLSALTKFLLVCALLNVRMSCFMGTVPYVRGA